jgi:molybdenum cofactor cytidylyltransferase
VPPLGARSHAVVLAAGAGRRFGGGKLTAPYKGRPLIAWSTRIALAAQVETATVVLGSDAAEVRAALSGVDDSRLRSIFCRNWIEGMSASLACGIGSLPGDAQTALIFLGDMPHVDPHLADRLLTIVRDGAPAAMPRYGDRPAHPVAVASHLFPELLALTGDAGARSVLRHVSGIVEIQTEDWGNAHDIDTRRDIRGHSSPAILKTAR